jgi:two-component system, NtrC family, sensor kinase
VNLPSNQLQAIKSAATAAAVAEAGVEARLRDRVLIVDDSAVERLVIGKYLSHRYDCYTAESYQDAVENLKKRSFSAVITDVIMPGLSGIELLRKIVGEYQDMPVIVLSGIDRPQRALDALRVGAFDYIFKPFDPEVLQMTVERAIEKRELSLRAKQYEADLYSRNVLLARQKAELERLQAHVVNSEKMASLGQLCAGIAHELNNPVGFIYGNMDILNDSIKDMLGIMKESIDDGRVLEEKAINATLRDVDSIINDCKEGAERIRDIVQNLRMFSRLDEAEFKKTDIHEGIRSTIRLLSRYFVGGNIKLEEDYGELPMINAYSGQLNQVWMNLLVNAAQAVADEGGRVTICTRQVGETVVVSVSDTGPGIDDENISKIFEPFFTTKSVGDGTGLGLSISFGIVQKHSGTISVKSKRGEGTTFIVTLPESAHGERT